MDRLQVGVSAHEHKLHWAKTSIIYVGHGITCGFLSETVVTPLLALYLLQAIITTAPVSTIANTRRTNTEPATPTAISVTGSGGEGGHASSTGKRDRGAGQVSK